MKSITLNDHGAIVERWQYFLIGEGFPITVTGRFDYETEKATKNFQDNYSLQIDGIAGNQTLQKAMECGFLLVEPVDSIHNQDLNWPPKPPFKPLTAYLVRQAFGKNTKVSRQNTPYIEIQKDWELDNIVNIQIPCLDRILQHGSYPVRVHKRIEQPILNLFKDWEENGLLEKIVSLGKFYDTRFISGSSTTISNHAYGIAFDINQEFNRTGHIPPTIGEYGSVRELVPLANKHGFYWGGHLNRLDGSHFEFSRVGIL